LTPPDEPVFAEPWEAQVFAMAVMLQEKGVFTWKEWAEALSCEISRDSSKHYYESWLLALDKILEKNNIATYKERLERIEAWDRAAKATPHGQPIELSRGVATPGMSPTAKRRNPGEPR
jgi:nitrile hydratase accessory protein